MKLEWIGLDWIGLEWSELDLAAEYSAAVRVFDKATYQSDIYSQST